MNKVKCVTYYYRIRIYIVKEPWFELCDEVRKEIQIDIVKSLHFSVINIIINKLYVTHASKRIKSSSSANGKGIDVVANCTPTAEIVDEESEHPSIPTSKVEYR